MNLRFPGQYFDKETNLHYNGFRHYNPKLGRCIQADPLGIIGGMNIYGYGYANPLFYYDPYGLWSLDPLWWAVDKVLPDAVTNAITNDTVVNGVAGFGDTLSFGITKWLRGKLDVGTVDYCSDAYSNGQWAGIGYSLAFGGAHLGRNALYQMGRRGSLGQRVSRGVGRLFHDNRGWGFVRDTWSKAAGNGKVALQRMGQDLHHWLFPQRWRWPRRFGLTNSGLNYMPISAGLNRYMNARTYLRTITEWGFKVTVIGIYGGLPTGIVSKIWCDCK